MPVGIQDIESIAPIEGVELTSVAANLRYAQRDDLVLMRLASGSSITALFTQNAMQAAPVIVAKEHLIRADKSKEYALLINAGNANAGTGQIGIEHAHQCCQRVAELYSLVPEQVLPFSTGVIGEPFDMPTMYAGISALHQAQHPNDTDSGAWIKAAHAIKTTDIVAKGQSVSVEIDGQCVAISGFCKGSGMICPNMATMLAFIATDAVIESDTLRTLLEQSNAVSFNRISVDSDTSTNDAVVLMATGKSQVSIVSAREVAIFQQALIKLMQVMAQSIVRDGEGASKFVEIKVNTAHSEQDAERVARSIAHSPLVKTALFASDPNWGRILAAIGKDESVKIHIGKVDVYINEQPLILAGELDVNYSESIGKQWFQAEEICIEVGLNIGAANYYMWTTDLSYEYVRINADYRS